MMNVRLIGITGGSGSGKSTVVRKIYEAHHDAVCIEQDNYYKSASYINNDNITAYNFDHPDAFDMDLMMQNLMDLKSGKAIEMPQYDFVHHQRKSETVHIEPKKIIIVDGLMVLYDKRIRDLLDLKLYVDTPADIRRNRRPIHADPLPFFRPVPVRSSCGQYTFRRRSSGRAESLWQDKLTHTSGNFRTHPAVSYYRDRAQPS